MNEYNIALLIALFISIIINIGLIWYNRKLIGRLLFVSQNLNDLTSLIETYRGHLKALYATEMYYGDETMQHLIAHTSSLANLLEDYEDIIYLTEPLEEITEEEHEIEKDETVQRPEKDVFYGGTREGNS